MKLSRSRKRCLRHELCSGPSSKDYKYKQEHFIQVTVQKNTAIFEVNIFSERVPGRLGQEDCYKSEAKQGYKIKTQTQKQKLGKTGVRSILPVLGQLLI